jgi:hypothetical protein
MVRWKHAGQQLISMTPRGRRASRELDSAAKYLTGEPATIEEGDWTGDGVFDQRDVVAALQTGSYQSGPYAAGAIDTLFAKLGVR